MSLGTVMLDRDTRRQVRPAHSIARISVWVDPDTQLAEAA